jgi:ankyrin repeat protein
VAPGFIPAQATATRLCLCHLGEELAFAFRIAFGEDNGMGRFLALIVAAILVVCVSVRASPAPDLSDDFYRAIRNNDLARLGSLIHDGADVNTPNHLAETPLMYAAYVGSLDAMKLLLKEGASVNLQSQSGATALIWAATDLDKVRLLIAHGANVNLATKRGRTALLVAAMSDPSAAIVKLLLEKGADSKAVDFLKTTPLRAATLGNDTETIGMLIEAGVDVNAADLPGITPLMMAAGWNGNARAVQMLLAKGANAKAVSRPVMGLPAKNGASEFGSLTALLMAAPFGPPDLIRNLLDAGSDVNAKDVRGMTPLMLAVAADHQDPAIVKLLLERGADPALKNNIGDSAGDWARRAAFPEGMKLLKTGAAPAETKQEEPAAVAARPEVKPALQKTLGLIEKSSWEFFAASGCVSCHAQSMTDWAVGEARTKALQIDEKAAAERVRMLEAVYPPEPLLERMDAAGAMEQLAYPLVGLAANRHPADRLTDAMVANIAASQRSDGSWHVGAAARPPAEEGDIFRTAVCIRALQFYGPPGRGPEMAARVAKARQWLLSAEATTAEDRNMQLMGLYWAGVGADAMKPLVKEILARQEPNGGWRQHAGLSTDAYATGESLYALALVGQARVAGEAWKRGVQYLLDTQRADGSWFVASHSPRIQAYFEGGFPYGHDQWISNWGTSWAALALTAAIDTKIAAK